ncbi:ergothioneine biosynthesis protein EgtB [Crateriforma conspicua]|uniref:ergothioneine biosynthesis protein EgtB n=1 Tax=Crateriforma conspicua TaxID=2527996 RepID=UPI0011894319|nr:ergothioneine biosynthesis protein EgtB [Crateriforma conspicua]QDV64448.1 Iron(II)-dependent oxidoreductase EgtB [Crateriforma conspicua]
MSSTPDTCESAAGSSASHGDVVTDGQALAKRYADVRALSDSIVAPLQPEDCVLQSMPDASPIRWHLAHTTWFFETFVLADRCDAPVADESFRYLFNSYYNTVGDQFPRHQRGLLSRPTVREVMGYRRDVDDAVVTLLRNADVVDESLARVIELGLNHEQQHQELMLTDIKHAFAQNPLYPAHVDAACGPCDAPELQWISSDGGVVNMGCTGDRFCFDNELPQHRVFLEPFQIANRLVTNAEYQQFIEDGGYQDPRHWLSAGWATVQQQGWTNPIYWIRQGERFDEFTLGGRQPIDPEAPVAHLSYFEADAFARWSRARLPTEAEWETVAREPSPDDPTSGECIDARRPVHPTHGTPSASGVSGLYGTLWQWTSSSYGPYPGYTPPEGALGEYNGKFMCNQYVLRGSSCATSPGHARRTYRNFFGPDARWQFTGIRLARSV